MNTSSCFLVDSNTLDAIHVTFLEDKEMDLVICLSTDYKEKEFLELLFRLLASSTQGSESGTELTTTNCPFTSFRVIMVFLPSHSCSWTNDPSSFRLTRVWKKRIQTSILYPRHLMEVKASNTLFHRKNSHCSSLSSNFAIDFYKARVLSQMFYWSSSCITSPRVHSLLWHIPASSGRPDGQTACIISINKSRGCFLFISLYLSFELLCNFYLILQE